MIICSYNAICPSCRPKCHATALPKYTYRAPFTSCPDQGFPSSIFGSAYLDTVGLPGPGLAVIGALPTLLPLVLLVPIPAPTPPSASLAKNPLHSSLKLSFPPPGLTIPPGLSANPGRLVVLAEKLEAPGGGGWWNDALLETRRTKGEKGMRRVLLGVVE